MVNMITKTNMPFLAGIDDTGQPVFESLEVELLDQDTTHIRLLISPLFVRNLAAGDKLRVIDSNSAEYELVQRSGNLSVRAFRTYQLEAVSEVLTPTIE